MGFSRQEYWSGVPLPSPGDLPHLVYWILGGVFKALCRQRPYSQTCDFSSSRVQMWELDHSLTDYSPPGFSVRGISQARILQWIAIPFSRGSSPPSDLTLSPALAGWFFTAESPGNGQFLKMSHGHLKEDGSRRVLSLTLFVIYVSTLLTILFQSCLFMLIIYLITLSNTK